MSSYKQLNVNDGSTKYVIPMDALDWTILTNSWRPSYDANDTALLWSRNNLNSRKEYLEFEIKAEFNDALTREATHELCYICNVRVPKPYILDHIRSSKHVAYQKITDTALKRAKNAKKMFEKAHKHKTLNKEYFCAHCVSIIKSSNRSEHEQSKKHCKFVALDAFLNKFATFYNNDKYENTKKSKIIGTRKVLKTHNLENHGRMEAPVFDVVPLKVNTPQKSILTPVDSEKLALENKLKDTVVLINDIEACVENTNEEVNNNLPEYYTKEANIVVNLKQYINLINKHGAVKLYTMDSIDNDRLRIETPDGSELIVSSNNFNGFKRTGKKNLQCKLCNVFVSNVNEHIITEKHIKIVSQQFEDKNCLRFIKESWYHCVVCNEVIDNPAFHILFNEHIRKLEQSLVPKCSENVTDSYVKENNSDVSSNAVHLYNTVDTNENNTVTQCDNEIINAEKSVRKSKDEHYCPTCNITMHVNNVATHLNGTKHILNSKIAVYYLMRKNKSSLECKVCDTNVQNFVWAVEDHIASADHVANYYKFLAANKIIKSNDMFFCNPCGEEFRITYEMFHVEKQSHKLKLASYSISYINQNKLLKGLGKICDDVTAVDDDSIEQVDECVIKSNGNNTLDSGNNTNNVSNSRHTFNDKEQSLNKENATANTFQLNNTNEIKLSDGNKFNNISNKKYCNHNTLNQRETCSEELVNSPEKINIQNKSETHKTVDTLLSGVNNMLDQLLKYFKNSPEIHSHLQRTDNENVLKCKVCSINVSIEDTDKHTKSLKHINAYRRLMKSNKMKFKDDRYLCYACNVYIESYNEIRHIDTDEHEQRMESLRNGDCVLITADNKRIIDKIDNDLQMAIANSSVSKANELQFSDFIPRKKRLRVNDVSSIGHYFSNIIDNKKQVICVFCQTVVGNTEVPLTIHINDKNHQTKHKTVLSYNQIFDVDGGAVCGFCEVIIPENVFEHISSENHIEKQKTYPNKNYCFTCKVSTIGSDVEKHVTSKHHIKNISNDKPKQYYCNICNLQLTNSETNIQRHNDGFQHKNNCSLIDLNSVILKNKKCYCQTCESDFSREGLEAHIASSNHIMLLGGDN